MAAIVVLSESDIAGAGGQPEAPAKEWHAICVSQQDPAALLRNYRSRNKRITGIGLMLYAGNEVTAGRVVTRALDTMERQGVRRDGRYVGATLEKIEAALRAESRTLNVPLYTPAERLALGEERLGRK